MDTKSLLTKLERDFFWFRILIICFGSFSSLFSHCYHHCSFILMELWPHNQSVQDTKGQDRIVGVSRLPQKNAWKGSWRPTIEERHPQARGTPTPQLRSEEDLETEGCHQNNRKRVYGGIHKLYQEIVNNVHLKVDRVRGKLPLHHLHRPRLRRDEP
ncbi:hypothetical protein CR513_57886, partial [Mucuna pruriens]